MRHSIVAGFFFCWGAATAQNYKCPPFHTTPGPSGRTALTSATMHAGELQGDWSLHGAREPIKGGTSTRYVFPEGQKNWLVCSYGSKKRISGTTINGQQWGQYMEWDKRERWIPLSAKVAGCELLVREVARGDSTRHVWTAEAVCKSDP